MIVDASAIVDYLLDHGPRGTWATSRVREAGMLQAPHLRHSVSVSDAAYVVLAETLRLPLLTTDDRLARSQGHRAEIVSFAR